MRFASNVDMTTPPTLRDIAKRANVSISTVSRVLNDQPGIGAKTRERVLAIAQELKFAPNVAARNLATKRTRNIGLVTYKWSVSSRLLASSLDSVGINEECERLGYHLVTTLVDEEAMHEPLQIPMVRERRVDGLILAGPAIKPSFVLELYNSGIPIVLLDNSLQGTDIDCVLHENELSTYRLTQHLIRDHRHETIVFLSGPDIWLSSRERSAGYRRALADFSLEPHVIHMSNTTVETGKEAMRIALAELPHLTAVVAVNDAVAVGAIRACKDADCSIPDGLAIVGFDNIGWAELHDPPLTTAHAFGEEMGRQAARRLIELIETVLNQEQEHVRLRLRVGTRLMIRSSCGCQEQ
jgi:DNA-binding LacI/PurR family transcriptional regulator